MNGILIEVSEVKLFQVMGDYKDYGQNMRIGDRKEFIWLEYKVYIGIMGCEVRREVKILY